MERRSFLKALVGAVAAIPVAGKVAATASGPTLVEGIAGEFLTGEALAPKAVGIIPYGLGSKLYIGGFDPLSIDKWQNIELIESFGDFGLDRAVQARVVGQAWVRTDSEVKEEDVLEAVKDIIDGGVERHARTVEFRGLADNRDDYMNSTSPLALRSSSFQIADLEMRQPAMMDAVTAEASHGQED